VSENTFAIWIPLVVSIVGLGGSAIIYQIQKAFDRKNQILAERRSIYREYVSKYRNLQSLIITADKATEILPVTVDFARLTSELLVTAPDDVVEVVEGSENELASALVAKFGSGGEDFDKLYKSTSERLSSIVLAMRKDSFPHGKIGKLAISASIAGLKLSLGLQQK
jgi:hypothetical protein